MGSQARLCALSAAAAALLVACGGGQGGPSTGSGRHTTPSAVSGQVVFAQHCSVCHSLDGRNRPRLQGGDLLGFHARRAQVVQFVREMPVIHRPLTSAELQAVVDYVMAAERRAAGH